MEFAIKYGNYTTSGNFTVQNLSFSPSTLQRENLTGAWACKIFGLAQATDPSVSADFGDLEGYMGARILRGGRFVPFHWSDISALLQGEAPR